MSEAPIEIPAGERFVMPWRPFRRRLIVLFEIFVVTKLMSFMGVGGDFALFIATLSLACFLVLFYVGLGSSPAQVVREVMLQGEFLTYVERKRVHRLDLSRVRKLNVRRPAFCVPSLELWFSDSEEIYHLLPLIGESGRRILDHVLARIPESAKPLGEPPKLRPYKPGLFRPREESLSLPEVR